jgi:multidrug resistance efflux pump
MSEMNQEKRVPLAWDVRWRRIRAEGFPIVVFFAAVFGSGWLWQFHGASVQGVGEVDSMRVDITSPTAGLVIALPHQTRGQWNVFDHVQAGDIIARIDDQQLEASKGLLRRDINELRDQITALQAQQTTAADAKDTSEIVARAAEYEQTRLQSLEQLLSAAPQLTGPELHDLGTTPPDLPADLPAATKDQITRLRDARRALDLRWEELSLRTGLLEIPAPISGTLTNVYCWPGQLVHSGGLIATIAADHGQHIVGYIPEQSPLVPKIGMRVTLRARVDGAPRIPSQVEEVGRQIEKIPGHQRVSANTPQWGLPVRIKLPNDASLRPGALVDIVFRRPDAP